MAMPGYRIHRLRAATLVFAVFALVMAAAAVAAAGDRVYSSMRTVNAVQEFQGYSLVPAPDYQAASLPGDLAPAQAFEIIRPDNEQVTIGRLFTSCTCIRAETEKRVFHPGERAIIILRNIRNTPPAGQLYGLYVQVTRPVRTTLQVTTFVRTGHGSPASSAPAATASATAPAASGMPAVVTPSPLRRGGPAVLVENEYDHFEATGDIIDMDAAEPAESDNEASDGEGEPAEAASAASSGLGDLPRVEGIPPEAAEENDSTEPRIIEPEGTADIIEAVIVPGADDADDGEVETEADSDAAPEQPQAALELPDGADVRESLGAARGDLENLFDDAEGSSAEIARNVDAARQAMDAYFSQGEGGAAPAPAAGGDGLAVATDIDGDIPDFYAHVPAAAAAAGAALPEADMDEAVRAASGLDPTLGVRPEGEVAAALRDAVAEAGADSSMRPPERNPNSRKPVQAVSLITVGVSDMANSIRFYEALGWRRASPTKYDQTAFFQLQGQILALYPMKDQLREQNMPEAAPAPGGITLALHVQDKADVWAVYQRFMDAGGTSLREPAELPSGAVTSYVADPDGNPWEVSWVPQFRIDEGGGLWLP